MPFDPVTFGVVAGTSVLAPIISKGIGSLFGLDEPSAQEREAAALQQEAIRRMRDAAAGVGPSAAKQAAAVARERAQQQLASLAQRGSVQQQAGNVRAAMQATPEIMARIGGAEAQGRAEEMSRAREALAGLSARVAEQQAAAGRAGRQYTQGLIGAGIQGIGTAAAIGLEAGKGAGQQTAPADTGTTSQASTAATPQTGGYDLSKPTSLQAPTASLSPTAQAALGGSAVAPTSMVAPPAGAPTAVNTAPTVAPALGTPLPSLKLGQKFTGGFYDGAADQGLHRRLAALGY